MRVAVFGEPAPYVRRALHDLRQRGIVNDSVTIPARASVGDLTDAARAADVLIPGGLDAATEVRVPLAALAARGAAVLPAASASAHRDHLGLADDALSQGTAIVTGASASPALSITLARHAARGLDSVESVEVAWALPPEALEPEGAAAPILEGLSQPALVRADGTFSYVRRGRPFHVAFPEPVGTVPVTLFGGPEAWRLPEILDGDVTVRVSLGGTTPRFTALLALPTAVSRLPRGDGAANALTRFSARLGRMTGDPGWAGVRVEVRGRRGATVTTRVLGGFDRLDAWNSAALALGLMSLASEKPPGPGVSVAGEHGTAVECLASLYDLGIRFAAFDPAA